MNGDGAGPEHDRRRQKVIDGVDVGFLTAASEATVAAQQEDQFGGGNGREGARSTAGRRPFSCLWLVRFSSFCFQFFLCFRAMDLNVSCAATNFSV